MLNKLGKFVYAAGIVYGIAIGATAMRAAYHKGAVDACDRMQRGLEEIMHDIEKRIESEEKEEA